MKNFLIYSFFVVMITLSGLTMIFGATIVTKKFDVNYRTISEDLDDNQIEYYNRKKTFEKLINNNELIEYREYKASNGEIWYYGVEIKEIDKTKSYVAVLDPLV